jgi:hypothetical protein
LIHGHKAEGGQRRGGFVVSVGGVFVIGFGRRVVIFSSDQLTTGKQARRLTQFFSLPLTPQASM